MQSSSNNGPGNGSDTYNRGGFIAFIFSMAFSIIFFIYIAVIHPGVDLKEVPTEGAVTSDLAGGAAATKVDVSQVKEPWVANEDMAAHGKTIFQQNCAVCHGHEGRGDGPAGKGLVPPPRNLVEGKWTKGGSSAELFHTVQNGILPR